MPESTRHARLVKAIIFHLEKRIGTLTEIMIRDDSVRPLRGERPPRLPRFMPDVYATDVPTTKTMIGEAKTARDLETDHSHKQIASFLEHLSHTPNSLFILAVPHNRKARARWLLAELVRPLEGSVPETEVIDDSGIDLE